MAFADDAWRYVHGLAGGEVQLIYYVSYMFLAWGALVAVSLQVVSAPYGRYARKGWGVGVTANVAWAIQELPSFAVPLLLLALSDSPKIHDLPNKIILGLFLLHYFQRTFIFSPLIKGGKATPLVPFLMAFVFCTMNGYLQGRYLLRYADFSADWERKPTFLLGIAMFFSGMFINIQSDSILRNLRDPGETCYKIPRGGMFEYVSGANFLGEILEWWGFAVASCTLPALGFAVFTTCNIGPRACQHHQWYRQKFEDYPKGRRAVLPFIL
ncbi:3-oxo-5-alpha-steroid 4-dehydrogenase 1-like isoform X1 [Haliotis rufescens]|uniref:3-oxo-5-alpha-steroid 4-dehydrogenase 1-like isoform X1 n=1 Tax=Haliotis rufescens TaxID=6454 RepID=UPI001EB0844D|nr:3-oxo-5-alpha-steroid 4-dehydrogenase 1-like isoform X1 [Haliotis rufescens]